MGRISGVNRRALLASTAAAGIAALAPIDAWASAGAPSHLTAIREPSGAFALVGLRRDGEIAFRIALPDRGHGAAARPTAPEAVAFARRPGRFAVVIDCVAGAETARLTPPDGRRFYGHGVFSPDGALLYTSENDYEAARGRIGVWDARVGYRRVGEFASGGVGPHEITVAPAGQRLIVANGGIETHPDSGRAKLNIPTMRPNLAYLDARTGALIEIVEPPAAVRRNSIRHLAARADGVVAAALQWEGAPLSAPPLLALHAPGAGAFGRVAAPPGLQRETRNYAGSVSFSADGAFVAYTAPRGGLALIFDAETRALDGVIRAADICGVAPFASGFRWTTGAGAVIDAWRDADGVWRREDRGRFDLAFDNHLASI